MDNTWNPDSALEALIAEHDLVIERCLGLIGDAEHNLARPDACPETQAMDPLVLFQIQNGILHIRIDKHRLETELWNWRRAPAAQRERG
jgi:hypothetical protein